MPEPQRGIAERVDAPTAEGLPGVQRAVRWDVAITTEPPVTPVAMGKSTRGVELASMDDFDERQLASWRQQAATMPFAGGRRA